MRLRTATPAASLIAALWVVLTAPVGASRVAVQQSLPTGRQIIDRHVAAIGGEAAYRAVRSVQARGRLEIPAQKIVGDLELYSARPARLLYRVTVAGVGRIENGYDGQVGWSLNPISGPELLTGRQLSEAADDAWFDATLHTSDHVREVTTLSREVFDGKAAYKVKVVLRSGNEQIEYFDVESGLQIGSESARTTPQGVVPTVNILRDYRKLGPVLQATTFVQRALGFEQILTITSCEYDTVPDSVFETPPAIRALLPR
jgi:hypothetical protein